MSKRITNAHEAIEYIKSVPALEMINNITEAVTKAKENELTDSLQLLKFEVLRELRDNKTDTFLREYIEPCFEVLKLIAYYNAKLTELHYPYMKDMLNKVSRLNKYDRIEALEGNQEYVDMYNIHIRIGNPIGVIKHQLKTPVHEKQNISTNPLI